MSKTVLTTRASTLPDVPPNLVSIRDWCQNENLTNAKIDRDIEAEFNKVGAVKRWTPALTFSTPGNLSVSYSVQAGDLVRTREGIDASFCIVTSAFTWTTSSGNLQITGLPYTSSSSSNDSNMVWTGDLFFQGITKASYTQFTPAIVASSNIIVVIASGSGQTAVNVMAADLPSGGSVLLKGNIHFRLKP